MNELSNIQVVMRGFEKQRDNSVVPFGSFQLSRCEVEVEESGESEAKQSSRELKDTEMLVWAGWNCRVSGWETPTLHIVTWSNVNIWNVLLGRL